MKTYPSIPRATGQSFRAFKAHVFDKIDGSNLRFEWSPKRGWYKFGTRKRLFDASDEVFGPAIALWEETFAGPLSGFASGKRWSGCTAFAEFHGPNSFAGLHDPNDTMQLTLIDMSVHKQGLMDPRDFVPLGVIVPTARYFGPIKWTRQFVDAIHIEPQDALGEDWQKGLGPTLSFEGVVGKAHHKRKRIMAKAKTKAWVDKVRSLYAPEDAEKLLQS